MHSKYDRLVVFLIVGGSLLMLFGAISSLSNYIGYINGDTKSSEVTISSQNIQSTQVSATKEPQSEALSENEKQEKKIVEALITAINDENKEEDVYKELLKLQSGKPEFALFKNYISFLRQLCQGNVVGYKQLSAKESKAIKLEMTENGRKTLVMPNHFKCFNLVSELPKTQANSAKKEKMSLLVLGEVNDKLEITEHLISDLLEPHYIARLYAEGLKNRDRNLLANLLYTDLPDDDNLRLMLADRYIEYYQQNIDISVDSLRIEEARPDTWLISFPKKATESTDSSKDLQVLASSQENVTQASLEPALTQTNTSQATITASQNIERNFSKADELVMPFNTMHFSPNYYTRWQLDPERHYVQLIRNNSYIVAIDYLPLGELASAWQVMNKVSLSGRQLNLSKELHLEDLKNVFNEEFKARKLLYNEAVYSGLIKPQVSFEDKADKIYSHVLNFKSVNMEVFSFMRRNEAESNPSIDMLKLNGNNFMLYSPIRIGMTRAEILKLYPSMAMADYRFILGPTVMELHFENQTKSGISMSKNRGEDKLTELIYYNVEWYQQDFDLANLHYVS